MRYAISILIMLVGFLFITSIAVDLQMWWVMELLDFPSLVIYLFVFVSVLVYTDGFKVFIAAVNAIFSKKYVIDPHTRDRAVRIFRLMGKAMWCTAGAITLIMFCLILMRLDDPGALGPMISVSLLSFVYAALGYVIKILPAIYILENRRNPEDKIVISERQVIDKFLELCYRQGISPEEIMEAEEINFRGKDTGK
jgi:hypothetical protein